MRHQIHIYSIATRSGEPQNALHSSSNINQNYYYTVVHEYYTDMHSAMQAVSIKGSNCFRQGKHPTER